MQRAPAILLSILLVIIASCGGDDPDPTATPPVGDGEISSPLIFVPGIAGTELLRGGTELWTDVARQVTSPGDEHLFDLRLDADGATPHPDTLPGDPIEVGEIVGLETIDIGPYHDERHFYDATVAYLEDAGYELGSTLFVFPYDWRLDVASQAELLVDIIVERSAASPNGKVDIVAHSMGGLLSMAALDDDATSGKVRRFVTIATPALGATKAFGVLEHRALCFTEYIFGVHCITNQRTVQEAIVNFPGVYQLLPTQDYQTAVGSPFYVDGQPVPYDEWTATVRANRNENLVDLAQAFHQQLSTRPGDAEIEMLRFVGTGVETTIAIEQRAILDCYFIGDLICPKKLKYKISEGSGDGTVPKQSAALQNDDGFDRSDGIPTVYKKGIGHMEMANSPEVLADVVAFLARPDQARIASAANIPAQVQFSSEEAELNGVNVAILGTAWGVARDTDGRTTGPVDGLPPDVYYSAIPGSSFARVADSQEFFFQREGQYDIQLEMLAPGSEEYAYLQDLAGENGLLEQVLLVEVSRYATDELAETTIVRVQPSPGGSVRIELDYLSGDLEIDAAVDRDGDGRFETTPPIVDNFEPIERGDGPATATVTASVTLAPLACVDFASLPRLATYEVGDRFEDGGATVSMDVYYFVEGQFTENGVAQIDVDGNAGGSGSDLGLNNINASFDFDRQLAALELAVGWYGGSINLELNGERIIASEMAELDGIALGDATLAVRALDDTGNLYVLFIDGAITTFAIGGQELWIDDVCPSGDQ